MGKPKPIRRHGPAGSETISQGLMPPPHQEELLNACIELGQDLATATETIEMYQEGILDGSDRALLEETIREARNPQIPAGMPIKREQPAMIDGKRVVRSEGTVRDSFMQGMASVGEGIKAAHRNPRNPNNSKQKTTKRDGAGRIIGLEDI